MRTDRTALLAAACLSLIVPVVLVANGCVSNNAGPPVSDDAGQLLFDSAIPPGPDATPGTDATVNDAGSPGADATSPDAGDTGSIVDSAPPPDAFDAGPMGKVRVAWFDDPAYQLPQLRTQGPAVARYDVCIAIHGTGAWQGPLLTSAGSPGLQLFDVSSYFDVPAAQYDVRVVFVTSGVTPSCAARDAGTTTDFTNLPAVTANGSLTVAAVPDWSSITSNSLDVVALVDDTTVTAGKVKLRFANTSSTNFDFGLGGGDVYTPLLTDVSNVGVIAVADPDAGTNGGVDTNGYLELDPITQIDMSIRGVSGDYGSTPSIEAPAGTVLSAFAVFSIGAPATEGILVCYDGQPSASSPLLTKCTPLGAASPTPTPDVVRFVNFIADAPGSQGIDFCVKYHSMPNYGPGSIGGPAEEGTTFAEGTERYDFHAGFTYDVRVVTGTAADCSTAITPDFQFVAPTDPAALSTIVLTGYVSEPDAGTSDAGADGGLPSAPFQAIALTDLGCASTETPPVARAFNAASASASPQTVTLSTEGSSWSATAAYGAVGTAGADAGDACGYAAFSAVTNGFLFTQGGTWTYSNTSQSETLYLFSSSSSVVGVLECDDNDPSSEACFVLPGGGG